MFENFNRILQIKLADFKIETLLAQFMLKFMLTV